MALDTYPGEPLESGQIRLIRLRHGAWTDPIVCDLYNTQHTNDDNISIYYYALSYVWGSRGVTREVILAGRPHKVTVNLKRALRYYRHHYSQGVDLWVDALCIDQSNLTERMHQVQLMGQIYSRCRKMVIYLADRLEYSVKSEGDVPKKPADPDVGEKRCHARHALQIIRELGSSNHLHEQQSLKHDDNLEYRLESLRRLMHAPFTPWWDRVWVVQEASLAPEIDVMQGIHIVPWPEFAQAALNFKKHSASCCSKYLLSLPKDLVKVVENFTERVLAVDGSRNARAKTLSLPFLLRTFRNRQASDPRDKVYALLSLAASSIVPDYSISEVDVFCRATMECISISQDLTVLNNDLGRKFREDLPSWVPDWGSPGSPIHDARAAIATTCYYACPHFSANVPQMLGRNLVVEGKEVATVCEGREMMWGETSKIIRDTLAHWWANFPDLDWLRISFWKLICGGVIPSHLWIDTRRVDPCDESAFAIWAQLSKQSPYYDPDYNFSHDLSLVPPEPFWRREVPSKLSWGEKFAQDVRTWREKFLWNVQADPQHVMGTVSVIERSVELATLYRRLLIFGSSSSTPRVGLGPSDAQVGDKLWVLRGGRTPFVLRRAGHRHFTIVGDCFVDGLMDDCIAQFESIPVQPIEIV